MAVQPTQGGSPPIPRPLQAPNIAQAPFIEPPDTFQRAEGAISRAIDASIASRAEQLKRMPEDIVTKLKILEKSLAEFNSLALENCALLSKSQKLNADLESGSSDEEKPQVNKKELEKKLDELEEPIEEAEKKLKEFMEKLLEENSSLILVKELLYEWRKLDRIKESQRTLTLRFMNEQVLNWYLNQLYFSHKTRVLLEEKKGEILKLFCDKDLRGLDLNQVTFDLQPHGSETHHRGKLPVKITFKLDEASLCSIFFKPRPAHIDEKIIQLFEELNRLPREQKSLDVNLPTYKIINIEYEQESFSLWEFIEGVKHEGLTASEVISDFPNAEEKKLLSDQLRRLESVCSFLGISDLHLENLIFANPGKENSKIVPIDLESLQPGNATGLFKQAPPIPRFTEGERALLDRYQQDLKMLPFRFVPLPTSHFLGALTRCDSFILMAQLMIKVMQEKNYKLSIPEDELEWLVLNDFLHNDVPYLTEHRSQIYYSVSKDSKVIARGGK